MGKLREGYAEFAHAQVEGCNGMRVRSSDQPFNVLRVLFHVPLFWAGDALAILAFLYFAHSTKTQEFMEIGLPFRSPTYTQSLESLTNTHALSGLYAASATRFRCPLAPAAVGPRRPLLRWAGVVRRG